MTNTQIADFFRAQYNKHFGAENEKNKARFEKSLDSRIKQVNGCESLFMILEDDFYCRNVDKEHLKRIYDNETSRFGMFGNPDRYISSFQFYGTLTGYEPHYYYYDGEYMQELLYQEMVDAYHELIEDVHNAMKVVYYKDWQATFEPIELKFASKDTQINFFNALRIAARYKDTSLTDAIQRQLQYDRIARDQYLVLSMDFDSKVSFNFDMVVNGKCTLTGGILFQDSPYCGDHWRVHT